jgi:hypothetical protein
MKWRTIKSPVGERTTEAACTPQHQSQRADREKGRLAAQAHTEAMTTHPNANDPLVLSVVLPAPTPASVRRRSTHRATESNTTLRGLAKRRSESMTRLGARATSRSQQPVIAPDVAPDVASPAHTVPTMP